MLYIPHFWCNNINTICVHQLLELVHDGCLWLGVRILIDDMLIRRIIVLPYHGVNLANAFVEKSQEKKLAEMMKEEYGLISKSREFLISSINDSVV